MVKKKLSLDLTNIVIFFLILFIISIIIYNFFYKIDSSNISNLTDQWIYNVTEINSPDAVTKMFCKNGNLVGTVSQIIREGPDIKKYFEYFTKLPDIKVINKKYNIVKVVDNIYINTAFITWNWEGLEKPIIARMTFLFKNKCIFQLHSSALPELNYDLKNISGLP